MCRSMLGCDDVRDVVDVELSTSDGEVEQDDEDELEQLDREDHAVDAPT